MSDFGKRLREIRSDARMSQSAVARAANTSQSVVSQIESGEREPSVRMLARLAGALGVSAAYLLGSDVNGLSPSERAHFHLYRSLSDEARKQVRSYAEYLGQRHLTPTGETP